MINYQCINKTTMEQTKTDEVKVEEIFSECRKTDLSDTEKEQIVIKNKIFIERNKTLSCLQLTAKCLQLTAKLMYLYENPQTFYPQRIEQNKTLSCLQLTAKLMHLHENPQTFYPQRLESISRIEPQIVDNTRFYYTECPELQGFLKRVENSPIKFKVVDELWYKSHVYSIHFTKNKHDKTIIYELH